MAQVPNQAKARAALAFSTSNLQRKTFTREGSSRIRCQASSQPTGTAAGRRRRAASSEDAATAQPQQQQKARLLPARRHARSLARRQATSDARQTRKQSNSADADVCLDPRAFLWPPPLLLWEPDKVPAPFTGQRGHLKFQGDTRFANTRQQAIEWLNELLHLADMAPHDVIVGCDTETPATFIRGDHKKTALLQLCYHSAQQKKPICLLIPLNRLGVLPQVLRVLGHRKIIKVGIGLTGDMFQLQRDYQSVATTNIQGLLDLSWLAHACYTPKPPSAARLQAMQLAQEQGLEPPQGYQESWGLAGLMDHVTEYSLPKSRRIRCSNWAQDPLSREQIAYAAADAYAGLLVYHSLRLKWLQVQQQQHRLRRELRSASSTSSSSSTSIDRGQDVLSLLVNEVVEGDSWDAATDTATTMAALKQQAPGQHHMGDAGMQQLQQPQQGSDTSAEMQYTWPIEQLVSQHLWSSCRPAMHWGNEWHQQVLQVGLKATEQQLMRSRKNAAVKLNAAVTALAARLNRISPPAM